MLISDLYDLNHTLAAEYLRTVCYPWEALQGIREWILKIGPTLPEDFQEILPHVWIHKTAVIAPSAHLGAPLIIGAETEVRHCAFIRESALIGNRCVVGNSTELKNVILFDGVQVPHFNYVGDSILGYRAHLGAGSITSNVKSDHTKIIIKDGEKTYETGLTKCGAMLGDFAEIGCNSVLNPGTVIGRNTNIYPLSSVRGVIPANSILKTGNILTEKI